MMATPASSSSAIITEGDDYLLNEFARNLHHVEAMRGVVEESIQQEVQARGAAARLKRLHLLKDWDSSRSLSASVRGSRVRIHCENAEEVVGSFVWATWSEDDERALRRGQDAYVTQALQRQKEIVTRLLGSAVRHGDEQQEWHLWSDQSWLHKPRWLDDRQADAVQRRSINFYHSDSEWEIGEAGEDPLRRPRNREAEREKKDFLRDIKRFYDRSPRPFRVINVQGEFEKCLKNCRWIDNFSVRLVLRIEPSALVKLRSELISDVIAKTMGEGGFLSLCAGGMRDSAFVAMRRARPGFTAELGSHICSFLPQPGQILGMLRARAASCKAHKALDEEQAERILSCQ